MTTTSRDNGAGVGDTVPMQRVPARHAPTRRGAHAVETTPVQRPRLVGVDATRGVALLGMMAVHALLSLDEEGRPTLTYSLLAGRASAVFAVLAGVGIALLTGRRRVEPGPPARAHARSWPPVPPSSGSSGWRWATPTPRSPW